MWSIQPGERWYTRQMLAWLPLILSSAEAPQPGRIFTFKNEVDKELAQPYTRETPFASSGARIWATNPTGWAFRDGVNWLYLSNASAFEVKVSSGDIEIPVSTAVSHPSHVWMKGRDEVGQMTGAASYTFSQDSADNPLTQPFEPSKRWTNWSSGKRQDWYSVQLGGRREVKSLKVWFFNDRPNGECAPPESVSVQAWINDSWQDVEVVPFNPVAGANTIKLVKPVTASAIKLNLKNPSEKFYTGIYGFEVEGLALPKVKSPLQVEGAKWITDNDVLVSVLWIKNASKKPVPYRAASSGADATVDIHGYPLFVRPKNAVFEGTLAPGEKKEARFALGVGATVQEAESRRDRVLAAKNPLADQVKATQNWFDQNAAAFKCSDPKMNVMYLHRLYNLKKNSLDPKLGRLSHKTFAEGRWRSGWYANVISYGAGHQIRESRWLKDPEYAWGHLETFTQNPRPDGIYPSHVTPKGQMGGKYTDWITATAWDAYLVHPDKNRLAASADSLAKNAEGWRNVYGWEGSPLLVVDDHWWTGMEWQPSFFSFNGYKTDKQQALRRVDLTSYNYGNEAAVAKVMKELGRTSEARRFEARAKETKDAVLKQMWDRKENWFMSLHSSTGAISPAKEVIGVYPFTFDLVPPGKEFDKAWQTLTDPKLFWTRYPLASAAKDVPAYDQNKWPIGAGGSICMWNGPSWPHANSLVLTGMANWLRLSGEGSLKKDHLFALFDSFTQAQFVKGHPWTGEFYNGDTGGWKTGERDYNHSTWIDPLVHDLVGIVPSSDGTITIDPLIPEKAWSWWVLDGQWVQGHCITVAWDSVGGKIAKGFKGFAVYLDGKKVFASPKLEKTKIRLR